MSKPVSIEAIVSRVNTHIELRALHRSLIELKELETIKDLVATYAHEINNPLTIAFGNCKESTEKFTDDNLESLKGALVRIQDVVRKIMSLGEVSPTKKIYSGTRKIYDLDKIK